MARLDVELTRRALVTSRTAAQRLILDGRVAVNGTIARRASLPVTHEDLLEVAPGERYVSRAAGKLAGALDTLTSVGAGGPLIAGRRALDAGASTGGFTEVLLQRGARHVVAVDVGVDQLDPTIRSDDRVTVLEHLNVRDLEPNQVAPAPQLLVADLSFISLRLVLAPLVAAITDDADAILLIKPQFEVGRHRLGSGGVVHNRDDRRDAIVGVLLAARELGLRTEAVLPSSVVGMHGNQEFLGWLRRDRKRAASQTPISIESMATVANNGRPGIAE